MEHHTAVEAAIEQLYQDYHKSILRYLTRLVSNRETAEDLCQETFIKALRHWRTLETKATVQSWLYRIATNTAYDYLRRCRRVNVTTLTDASSLFSDAYEPGRELERAEPIEAALNRLPAHYRIPLVLYAYAGYELKDIALALGSKTTTIKTRVHRARTQFRQVYRA
jgi:RNA polymerase sigma-70 factor (ECF subfamily)